jgi:phosphopantetheine adenylyltransferase
MAGSYTLLDKIKNKLEFSKRNGTTLTGEPADEIIVHGASGVNKYVKEEKEKHAVFTFGRFNPPTTGHQKLVDTVKNMANTQGGDHYIFASHSQDKAKNPLEFGEKVGFMKKMFPKTNIHSSDSVRNIIDVARHLQAKGVTHGTLVVGSDRVDDFHNLLSKYNKNPADADYDPKKHFYIPHLHVASAGERDPDAEDVTGMSASKMRAHAAAGNFNEFKKGVPAPEHAQSMYDTLRQRMGIKESIDEQSSGLLNTTGTRTPQELRTMKTDRLRDKIDNKLKKPMVAKKSAASKEDEEGRRIAKSYKTVDTRLPSDMTQHPYEETRYVIPMNRPGEGPVDIGMDKDLETSDKEAQHHLKRRKEMKRFKQIVAEGTDGDNAYSDKPSAFGQLNTPAVSQPIPRVKQRVKNIDTKPVAEEHDDESGMAKNQLDTVIRGAKELKSKIKDKKDLPAWVQSKITKGEDQIDTVADYMKSEEKRGLWANIHAKRERIKKGSGEHMRKPGSKGAPTKQDFIDASEEIEHLEERGADSKGYFRSTESGAGLTKKGVAHFRRENPGSKLQTAVTEKNPKGKRASRRKSFCARMSGMPGPMKDEKGRPTRKAMSLRRWRCG